MSISANARPATTPQRGAFLRVTLSCETALRLFMDRNLDGPPSDSRLDGDQAERCDGNLPFASGLIALLSMTPLGAQAFAEGEIPFSAVGPTV
jgi:hypothetical protein